MYKRPRETVIKKKKDEKARRRNIIVNFRMSVDEKRELDERIALSGKLKQTYMIQSTLNQKLVVVGDKKLFEKMDAKLEAIYEDLKRVESADALDLEKLDGLRSLKEIMEGIRE